MDGWDDFRGAAPKGADRIQELPKKLTERRLLAKIEDESILK